MATVSAMWDAAVAVPFVLLGVIIYYLGKIESPLLVDVLTVDPLAAMAAGGFVTAGAAVMGLLVLAD